MRSVWIGMLVLAAVVSAEAGRKDWKVGVQAYTFRNRSLLETVEYCAKNGIKYIEIYPGQRIGAGFEGQTTHEMSGAEAGRLQTILKQKGVSLLSYGVVGAGNEAQWRPIFDFAKRMGISTIIEYESGNAEAGVAKCVGYLRNFVETGKAPGSAGQE